MPNVVCLFVLMLLPILVVSQTSRVQGFSVVRDQRESYILEVRACASVLPVFMLRSNHPHKLCSLSASYPKEFCVCE